LYNSQNCPSSTSIAPNGSMSIIFIARSSPMSLRTRMVGAGWNCFQVRKQPYIARARIERSDDRYEAGPGPLQSAKNGGDDRGQRKQSHRLQQPMNEPGVMTFLVPHAEVNPNRWVLRIACEDRQSIGVLYPHEVGQFNEEPIRCRARKSSETAH
jgi:hypothetical protein